MATAEKEPSPKAKRKTSRAASPKDTGVRPSAMLAPEILDALAEDYLSRPAAPRERVKHCVTMHFPNSGSTTKPSERFTRRAWRDRANTIAACVTHVPGIKPVPHEDVVVLLDSNYDNTRNDLLVALYAKLDV